MGFAGLCRFTFNLKLEYDSAVNIINKRVNLNELTHSRLL